MKKLIILMLIISNYIESSSILKKSMDYTSPSGQRVSKKTTTEIRKTNISKTLSSYIDYLRTGEGENIDWDNLKDKGFVQEDIEMMKRWIRNFYFEAPHLLEIAHSKLPAWISNEFENITHDVGLNLETNRLGPVSIRNGIVNFIIRKTQTKHYFIKKEHKEQISSFKENYKKNFLNKYIEDFEYIENIDSTKATNTHKLLIRILLNILSLKLMTCKIKLYYQNLILF